LVLQLTNTFKKKNMKQLGKFLFLFCFCSILTNSISAQEELITESSEPLDEYYIDDIVQRTLMVDNGVLPWEHVREADIAWTKKIWRVIDVREKMNLPFQYPGMPLFQILKEMVENGDAKAFKYDTFKDEILPNELANIVARQDTIVVFNDETYEEEVKIVSNDIDFEKINRFRVKEVWYFDEEASQLKVRILGIAPIIDEVDPETNVFKYSLPLFWVYYPEARETFAKFQVFNEFNNMAPMSWYDLFEKRFFSSYIYKENNALDASLKNLYEDGIEVLLESEKIKAELFNFEHDLWEY